MCPNEDDPNAPTPPPAHEPHGVVETLREEIVEHVPQPVRWTVGKLVRLVSLVLVGVLLLVVVSVVLYLMNRTELVARETALILNRTLRDHSDLVLELRDLRGNPLTGFRAVSPRVRYRDGAPLLAASELRVRYSLWSLLTGGPGNLDVTLVRPEVALVGRDSSWRLPKWKAGPERGRAGKPHPLSIRLRLEDARLAAPRPLGVVTGLSLDLTAVRGRDMRVRLAHLRWADGPWDSRLEEFAGEFVSDDHGVSVTVSNLRTQDLHLRARAKWAHGEGARHVHAELDHVRWAWLAQVFDNDTFNVPGSGAAELELDGERTWRGRFRADLDWDGLRLAGAGRLAWNGTALALDSLRARSLAGNLSGSLRWRHEGWEISGEVVDANPEHWGALQLDGWPAGDLAGSFRYRVDTRRAPVATLEADLTASGIQGWQVDDAAVRLWFPANAPDSFSVVAHRRGGRIALHARTNPEGWGGPFEVEGLPLEEWPDGRATGLSGLLTRAQGHLEARGTELFVTGDLEGEGTRWGEARMNRWRLSGVEGRMLPTPELSAAAEVDDAFMLGLHFDRVKAPIELGDEVVRFLPLTAMAGDTTLAMTGQAGWHGEQWWMTVASADLASRHFHWRVDPPLRLTGDPRGVVFERVVADDREAHVEVEGRWASPGGPYDFRLVGSRLALQRLGMPDELGLSGRADVTLDIQGRSGDPRWRFEARTSHPGMQGHASDSLWFVLSGGAHRLRLEDGRFDLGGGSLRAEGTIERTPAAFPDSLTPTALMRWLKDAGEWRGRVSADRMPVAPLASVVPEAKDWTGRVKGSIDFSGRPAAPEFSVQASAERFGWRDIVAERVDLQGHHEDDRFDLRELRVRMLGVESTVNLSLPVHLALGEEPVLPDAALRGRIAVPAGDLKVLPLIVPQIQSARGRFVMSADVSGTPRAPRLEGNARIEDGVVRPINRAEVLEGVQARLHFDESRIVLDTLTARQGRTGRVWGKGIVRLDQGALRDYRFDLSMRQFAAAEPGLYAVLFDGDFVVSDGPLVGKDRLPLVTGRTRIKRGVIELDFANQTDVQKRAATTQQLFWTYRIRTEATSNLRWRPPGADLEFDCDLDLQQTPDSLLIFGEMHALRGTYWFLSNRFRITKADITFDNQSGVDPLLDISAETRVPSPVSDGRGPAMQTVTAQITGRSSKPVIALASSDPTVQTRDILAALTISGFRDDGSGRLPGTDPLSNYFTQKLNASLSENLSQFFKGRISEWEIDYDRGGLLSGEGSLMMGVGSQVTDRLAFRYRQRLPGFDKPVTGTTRLDPSDLFEQNMEAEYRVNRFISITSGVSRRRNALVGVSQPGTDYHLSLKGRWEY